MAAFWWVTPDAASLDHRHKADELVGELTSQLSPSVPVRMYVVDPSQGHQVPPDAQRIIGLGDLSDEEIDRVIEEDRDILEELAKL